MAFKDLPNRFPSVVNEKTKVLEIDKSKEPTPYPEAAELATQSAKSDSESFRRRQPFQRRGTEVGELTDESKKKTVP